MDESLEKEELHEEGSSKINLLKTGVVLAGATAVLMVKGYISAKLLMGAIILDFFTTDIVKKIPLPICIIVSLLLFAAAFLY